MKNYFEYNKKLNIDDVSFTGYQSPADIMATFQSAITLHTLDLGVDFESIHKSINAKWFIVHTRIEIEKTPKIHDEVTVCTWPLKASAVKFPRACTMKDKEGNTLACAMTDWCIVDFDSGELLRSNRLSFPFDEFLSDVPTKEKGRIPVCEKGELCYNRKMLVSDLDLNRHVNNVTYIRIALDSFSSAELESITIKSMDMQYKMQCFEGQTLSVYKMKTEDGYIIDGLCDDNIIFRAKIEVIE